MTTKEEISDFIRKAFPHGRLAIETVGNMSATITLEVGPNDLRSGGTVAGPVLMGLGDAALYIALLGEIGIVPLAVTSSLTINFLSKPEAGRRIIGICKLLKVGRSLAVGEVSLYSEGKDDAIAHVVGTYSIPSRS